eukprot:CFRG0461T1
MSATICRRGVCLVGHGRRNARKLHSSVVHVQNNEDKGSNSSVVNWMNKLNITSKLASQTLIGKDPNRPSHRERKDKATTKVLLQDELIEGYLTDLQTEEFFNKYRELETIESEDEVVCVLSKRFHISKTDTSLLIKYCRTPLFKKTAKGIDVGVHSETNLIFP